MSRALRLALGVALALPLPGPGLGAPPEGGAEDAAAAGAAPPETGRALPFPIDPPEQLHAFPPEILARMRAALLALEAERDGG